MSLQPLLTTSFMGLILVGAWSGLAFGLGTLLSVPPEDDSPGAATSVQHGLRSASFDARSTDPCTDELVEVEPRLTMFFVKNGEAGGTSIDVDVRLENHPGTASLEGIDPLVRHFAFYATPISGAPYAHSLRTPLAGRHSSLDLVVDLVGGINVRGDVNLSMSSSRIDVRRSPCSTLPPGQPVTQLVQFLLAN